MDSVCEATNMNFTQFREAVEDRRAWHALFHGVTKSWTRLNDDENIKVLKRDIMAASIGQLAMLKLDMKY